MKEAATYYHANAASHGGYVYYYSLDLSQRWGEGKASPDMLFVQPPGTPTVGMAYLKAYEATGDEFYLKAARDAAGTLMYGQLQSGGWSQKIFYVRARRMGKYRNGKGDSMNNSSLDDGQTQAALTMLMRLDEALEFKDADVHEATMYGLNALLAAQFPNGAFPQVWTGPAADHPVRAARHPDYDWRTENRIKNYWDYYTLNDDLAGDVTDTLMGAHRIYKDEKYLKAIEKLGGFLIAAQMSEPQPGWCQQYNYEMYPIWARKFEPPAITGWESQDVMRTLIRIANYTGDKKYLKPIPKALAYYRKLILPEGKVARYYELKTDKPLYMDRNYQLTYDDRTAPSHYGWKMPAHFDRIERAYDLAVKGEAEDSEPSISSLRSKATKAVEQLDDKGRWVSVYDGGRLVGQPKFPAGFRYLSSGVFSENLESLSDFIIAQKRK